jgi:FkbM family methyltransferase
VRYRPLARLPSRVHARVEMVRLRRRVQLVPYRNIVRIGSDYGGWAVPADRIGPQSVCYCVGIGEDTSFDVGLIERYGCTVHAFDPTPAAVAHVAREPVRPRFHFHPVGLWSTEGEIPFHAPQNPADASYSALNLQATRRTILCPVKRLSTLMSELGHDHLDLLKMDIEGAEFEVLDSIVADRLSIDTICVEFHRDIASIDRIAETIRKLDTAGWRPVCAERWNYTLTKRPDRPRPDRRPSLLADATSAQSRSMRSSETYTRHPGLYWEHQRPIGRVGGELNRWKFEPYIGEDDVVVDFGCGGGYLLARLPGREKIGVDASPLAREEAERQGLRVVAGIDDLTQASADVVVSNHTLEHTLSPFDELRGIARVLRPGGKLILVLPIDDWRSQRQVDLKDPDRHLYTWTPLLITNLLREAGFDSVEARVVTRAWHPRLAPLLRRRLPSSLRRLSEWVLAVAKRRREVHAVAVRAGDPSP